MWGKVFLHFYNHLFYRITPTYVGKSNPPSRFTAAAKDHPHVCGEKFMTLTTKWLTTGSPPRMWGKGDDEVCSSDNAWDHPHVCGEKPQ